MFECNLRLIALLILIIAHAQSKPYHNLLTYPAFFVYLPNKVQTRQIIMIQMIQIIMVTLYIFKSPFNLVIVADKIKSK